MFVGVTVMSTAVPSDALALLHSITLILTLATVVHLRATAPPDAAALHPETAPISVAGDPLAAHAADGVPLVAASQHTQFVPVKPVMSTVAPFFSDGVAP